jgi:hypothetical protein
MPRPGFRGVVFLGLLLAACGGTTSEVMDAGTRPDGGPGPDAGMDAGPGQDAGPADAGTDAGHVFSCATGCGNGLGCVTNSDFPNGACTASCTGGGCPTGTVCSPALSSHNRYCLQSCGTAVCPPTTVCTNTSVGAVCLSQADTIPGPVSCAPPQPLLGTTPGPATDPGCRMPQVGSSLSPGDVQVLGTHTVGDVLSFDVPAGSIGFSIVSQAVSAQPTFNFGGAVPNLAVPSPLLTPSGATFFTDFVNPPDDLTTTLLVSGLPSENGVAAYAAFSAALNFPNSSAGLSLDGGLPSGTWTFGVNDYAFECAHTQGCSGGSTTDTYATSVVVSPGPLPSPGTLAVDIYLVTESLDAGAAVSSPAIQAFVARFASFYAQAHICISSFTFHDVPAWAQAKYDSVAVDYTDTALDPCSDYHQLFTLGESSRSIPLFFIDDITAGNVPPGDEIVGEDGAIPGPPTFNGTVAGGAVVLAADLTSTQGCTASFSPNTCGPDRVAAIGAHESGHFLGLFHPTESSGTFFDPLIDTPACVCALCETSRGAAAACGSNPDGGEPTVVDNSVCDGLSQQCGGAPYLMFWLLTVDTQGVFSAEESRVMRANPLIAAP